MACRVVIVDRVRVEVPDTTLPAWRRMPPRVSEKWSYRLGRVFETIDKAEDFVVKMNLLTCRAELGLTGVMDPRIVRERCLSPQFAHRQRYFTYFPDAQSMRDRVAHDAARV